MENELKPFAIPKTLSQSIYSYLKNAIINNKLKANQRINEKEIALFFNVSTTPVREAVLMLGAEGFVTINSHREAVVKGISSDELKEIFQVLSILDGYGTCSAVDYINSQGLEDLEALTEEMRLCCQLSSLDKYMKLNMDIHKKIWEFIPSKFLRQILCYVSDQMLRYNAVRSYAFSMPGVIDQSLDQHREIIIALKTKNKKRIKNLMMRHWGSILRSYHIEEGLREYLSPSERR